MAQIRLEMLTEALIISNEFKILDLHEPTPQIYKKQIW